VTLTLWLLAEIGNSRAKTTGSNMVCARISSVR